MKVLFVASTDSYNFSLPPLAHKFMERGHRVKVLLTQQGDEHNRMFYGSGLPYEFYEGEFESPEQCDVAVYQALQNPVLLKALEKHRVFRISMVYHLVPPQYVLGEGFANAHLTFCFGESFRESQIANGVYHELVPIGSPQHDELVELSETEENSKTILFLEQHFYPAGNEGKSQLADMLLDAAKRLSDYRIVVKPRTIPSELKLAKHKAAHIYDFIQARCEGHVPDNLILLEEHLDLNALTAKATVVATTFSTAAFPAILLNKPVVFVSGFATEDTEFYNRKVIESYYDGLRETGCVVDFRGFVAHLPQTAPVPKMVRDRLYYNYDGKASDRIVTMTEFLYQNVIERDIVPPILGLSYDNYESEIHHYISTYGDSRNRENELAWQINCLYNKALEEFYLVNLRSGHLLAEGYTELREMLSTTRRATLECIEAGDDDQAVEQFSTKCKEQAWAHLRRQIEGLVSSDKSLPIGFKGWYIGFLYEQAEFERIKSLPSRFHVPDYLLYAGLIATTEKRYAGAQVLLEEFLKEHEKAQYRYTPAFHDSTLQQARWALIKSYLAQLRLPKAIAMYRRIEDRGSKLRAVSRSLLSYRRSGV